MGLIIFDRLYHASFGKRELTWIVTQVGLKFVWFFLKYQKVALNDDAYSMIDKIGVV